MNNQEPCAQKSNTQQAYVGRGIITNAAGLVHTIYQTQNKLTPGIINKAAGQYTYQIRNKLTPVGVLMTCQGKLTQNIKHTTSLRR